MKKRWTYRRGKGIIPVIVKDKGTMLSLVHLVCDENTVFFEFNDKLFMSHSAAVKHFRNRYGVFI